MRRPWLTGQSVLVVETVLVAAVFALHGGWPTPDVNEPHYLCKARHYWDPTWCAGDFFLEAADAHQVFYWSVGWLAAIFPLPVAAWIGRILGWTLLAEGWRRLSRSVVPVPGLAVLSAAAAVAANDRFHVAGEWFVGGFEAKVFAYGLVFFALAAAVRREWSAAVLWLGGATAFHPVVGGWATLSLAGVALWSAADDVRSLRANFLSGRFLLAGVAAAGLAALGVVPALLLNRGAPPAVLDEANRLYVFERLRHHLDVWGMNVDFAQRFAIQLAVVVVLAALTFRRRQFRPVVGFMVGSLAFWLAGAALGMFAESHPEFAARWLRYYWFRLADVAVPLTGALAATYLVARAWQRWRPLGVVLAIALAAIPAWHFNKLFAERRADRFPRADATRKILHPAAWHAICQAIAADPSIPPTARFLTPRLGQSFKWYTGRPEVATSKDMPQDAASLVEWMPKLADTHASRNPGGQRWLDTLADLDAAKLIRVARRHQAEYILTTTAPQRELEVVLRNEKFIVYRVPPDSTPTNVER